MADSTAASTVKRPEQLRRWQSSDTNGQSPEPRVARSIHFPSEVEFLSACKTGDKDEIASFLAQGADINTTNPDGLTALHQACIDNDLEIVEFLVDQGAEVNCRDNDGWTPLHATASGGSLSIAKYLVSHDADVAAVNYYGDLPLDIALNDSMQNFLKTVMEDQGVDAEEARNAEINALRQDSLFWAEHGYDPEITDSVTGGSALHVCAAKGYIDVLQILLEACGADPNCVDYEGWTPLHAAALWGKQEAAQLLLKFGADPCLKNCNGLTCADVADASVAQLLSETISRLALPNPSVTKNKRKLSPPRHGVKRADTQEASEPASKAINVEVKKTEKKTLTTIAPKNTHDAPVYPSTSGGTHVSEDSFRWRRSASYSTKQDPPEDGGVLHRSRSIDNDISSRLLNNPVSAPTKTPSSSQPPENSTPVDFKVVITEPDDDAKNDVHEKPRLTAKERRDKFYIWQQSVTSEPSPVLNKQAVVRRSFVPPTRDEESETQRKVNAKRVRETRRSTQGVTLDEIKSAEQLLKKKSSSSGPSTDSPTNGAFEIEDNDRATCPNPAPASAPIPEATATMTIPRAPAGSNANTTVSTMSPENNGIEPEENNKDNSATMERTNQSNPQTGLNLIQRRRRLKRRPTGINPVEVDAVSDAGATGDSEVNNREAMQSDNESTEGGEKRDYKSLYEKAIEEYKRLYELLASTDLQLRDALTTISAMSTLIQSDLETENQRLKEENGALIRIISKLSK